MFDLNRLSHCAAPIRIGGFLLLLLLVWVPLALPLYGLTRQFDSAGLLVLILLYVEFICLVQYWGRRVYGQPNLLRAYGLVFSRRSGRELSYGFGIGVGSLLTLCLWQTAFGWVRWQSPSLDFGRIAAEGLLMAIAVGFAEEILFRGWLLGELQRDYRSMVAAWISALVFAGVHRLNFQFPSLVVLGLALAWAKHASAPPGLALSIGIHAGLVWSYYLIAVGHLMEYTGQAPAWITGIDRNPLAGVMGFSCLTILALSIRYCFRAKRPPP